MTELQLLKYAEAYNPFGQSKVKVFYNFTAKLDPTGGFYHENYHAVRAHAKALVLKMLKSGFSPLVEIYSLDENTVVAEFRASRLGGPAFTYAVVVDISAQRRQVTEKELWTRLHRIGRKLGEAKRCYSNVMYVFLARRFTIGCKNRFMGRKFKTPSGKTEFFFLYDLECYVTWRLAEALQEAFRIAYNFFKSRLEKAVKSLKEKALNRGYTPRLTEVVEALASVLALLTPGNSPRTVKSYMLLHVYRFLGTG